MERRPFNPEQKGKFRLLK